MTRQWFVRFGTRWHISRRRAPITRPLKTMGTLVPDWRLTETADRSRCGRVSAPGRVARLLRTPPESACRNCLRGLHAA